MTSKLYYTIGEIEEEIKVPQHTIRAWEKVFLEIKPRRARSRRYYRPQDLEFMRKLKIYLIEKRMPVTAVKVMVRSSASKPEPIYDIPLSQLDAVLIKFKSAKERITNELAKLA